MKRLPEPNPPATVGRVVMARVARLAEESGRVPFSAAASAQVPKHRRVGRRSDVPAWVAAFAGLAVVFVSWFAGALETRSWLDFILSETGAWSLVKTLPDVGPLLALVLGLLLYLAGLLMPVRSRR
jgi:hypothetical protein